MLDRKLIPSAIKIDKIDFKKATSKKINKGLSIHYFHQEDLNVIRAKFMFDAGVSKEKLALVASFTNELLLSGCEGMTSYEIAKSFDNMGAFIDTECSADYAGITLHCLSKDYQFAIVLINEILNSVSFTKNEYENVLAIKKQKFKVNNQKVSFIAKNEFNTFLFGANHPYSNKIELEDYNQVTLESIKEFYKEFYLNGPLNIYLSGNVNDTVINITKNVFGERLGVKTDRKEKTKEQSLNKNEYLKVSDKDSIQTAIRFGMPSISKNHKDFPKLYLANVILGGYFGSRLMNNIREDKGYTYGIGSGLINLKKESYFVISTEVGSEVVEPTIVEIEKEMNILSKDLVSSEELNRVKNYTVGSLLKGFDGSFALMDRFQMLQNLDLDYSYYENLMKEIKNCSPKDIQEVCRKYFNFSKLKKVLVGKV